VTGAQNPATHASSLISFPGEWANQGNCAGSPFPDLWYANDLSGEERSDVNLAKRICRECPVKAACLEYALAIPDSQDWGIWGATTEHERAKFRRKQRRTAA
jgi:WhiB family redox-sensing transcriptional regulator